MESVIELIEAFYETRVLSYFNTLLAYPIKIVLLLLDVLIVLYLAYAVIKMLKGTRAMQLLKGIALLLIINALSEFLSLNILHYILNSIMTYGVLLIIVVFQPELRKALEQVGNTNIKKILEFEDEEEPSCVEEVVKAAEEMAKQSIGALMVFERDISLGDYIHTGVAMGSKVSKELLINVFIPDTPLHDGAVIIKDNKIQAASCILPLTDKESIDRIFGTRHRAAIGVTENTDAVVVVVSEETGAISLAIGGKIIRDISGEQLRKELAKRVSRPKKNIAINYLKRKQN